MVMGLVIAALVVVVGVMGYRMHRPPEGSTAARAQNMHVLSNPTSVRPVTRLVPRLPGEGGFFGFETNPTSLERFQLSDQFCSFCSF